MIPISLSIQGLYSYQTKQTIDFEKLCANGLFGIFGSVGSGKSSVLEAISFALYGETERLNQRERRNYNMLNLRSDELLIDFVFGSGTPLTHYRFTVQGRRNSRNFNDVKSLDRKAYKKEIDGTWIPLESANADAIIGLNYTNFRRTVIIPQGKFQEFLMLGDTERTQMLKDIFSLERFDLIHKVKRLEQENTQAIANLSGQLLQLEHVAATEIEKLKDRKGTLTVQIAQHEKQLRELTLQYEQLKNLKNLTDELRQHQEKQIKMESEKPEIVQLKKAIDDYQYCTIQFKPLLDKQKEINAALLKLKQQAEAYSKQQINNQQALLQAEPQYNELKIKYAQRDELLKNASDMLKTLEIRELNRKLNEISEKIQIGKPFTDKLTTEIDSLQQVLEQNTQAIEQQKQSLTDTSILTEAGRWFDRQKAMNRTYAELLQQQKNYDEQFALIRTDADKCTKHVKALLAEYKHEFINFAEAEKWLTEQLEVTDKEIAHNSLQIRLQELTTGLQDGLPCPVCGATDHPAPLENMDVSGKINILKVQSEEWKKAQKNVLKLEKEWDKLQIQLSELEKNSTFNKEKIVALEKEKSQHTQLFIWDQFDKQNEDVYLQCLKQNKELNEQIKKQEGLLKETAKTIAEKKEIHTKAIKKLEVLLAEQTGVLASEQTLKTQIDKIQADKFESVGSDELNKQAAEQKKRYTQIAEDFEKISVHLTQLRSADNLLKGQQDETTKQINEREVEQAINQKNIDTAYQSGTYTHDTVTAILAQQYNIPDVQKKIDAFFNSLYSTEQAIQEAKNKINNREFTNEAFLETQQKLNTSVAEMDTYKAEYAKVKHTLLEMEQKMQEKEKLSLLFAQKQLRQDNISTLRKLFTGSGFVNYVSRVYLQDLCDAANQRFYKLTNQHLQLELNENNNFEVRDFMNEGRLRSVKTLSGGQIFQASLSLALALADSVQSKNQQSRNFFFLDEGFGSLDKNSLRTVFETLSTLRNENRVVGIISHVEELQQDVSVHLIVDNTEGQGSRIRASWQ